MKHIYTTIIALLIASATFATADSATKTGAWETNNTWNLNRTPQHNDSIIIPAGYTVSITSNVSTLNNVVLVVYGTLSFNNGKLRLDNASRVIVRTGGMITGTNSNDQLTIGGILKFSGTETSVPGYSMADVTTGTSPTGFAALSSSALPVTFQSFYIARRGSDVQLNWSTSQELNNKYYQLEKSTDGRNWKQVAVIIGSGTSSSVSKYAYTDKNVSDAIVYYRIRQVDVNGNALYSAIRTLRSNIHNRLPIFILLQNKP